MNALGTIEIGVSSANRVSCKALANEFRQIDCQRVGILLAGLELVVEEALDAHFGCLLEGLGHEFDACYLAVGRE